MVEMTFGGLAHDATGRKTIILLVDPARNRQVPIEINHSQGESILAIFHDNFSIHPVIHELIMNLMTIGGIQLREVIIRFSKNSHYQAELKFQPLKSGKGIPSNNSINPISITAHPSDGITLALRSKCKIWMYEKDIANTSIPIDQAAAELEQEKFRMFLEEVTPEDLFKHLKDREFPDQKPIDFKDSSSNDPE